MRVVDGGIVPSDDNENPKCAGAMFAKQETLL
jgi:hypothetical protein